MLRKSVGTMESHRPRCSCCGRTPLVGEFLHRLEPGRLACSLCVGRLPEIEREALSSERVHAGERALPVAPRAA